MGSSLYHSVLWRKIRASYLLEHPLCVMCLKEGRDSIASVVDHKIPHHDDPVLFYQESNFQPLCYHHHNSIKQQQELHGYSQACDVNGFPLDAGHPFNQRR